jgi:hypothetical protein
MSDLTVDQLTKQVDKVELDQAEAAVLDDEPIDDEDEFSLTLKKKKKKPKKKGNET